MKKYFILLLLIITPNITFCNQNINTKNDNIIKKETKLNIRKEKVKIFGNKNIDVIFEGNNKFSPTNKLNLNFSGSDFIGSNVSIEIDSNTTIKSNGSGILNLSTFGIQDAINSNKQQIRKLIDGKNSKKYNSKKRLELIKKVKTFEFGIPGTSLIFSKPVKIEINTPELQNGTSVEIYVKHEGDNYFGVKGITLDNTETCNPDGSVNGKKTENSIVENGKITFYSCSASSYTINPTGGISGSNDLKLIIGDCAQIQPYYNGLTQIYGGNPTATGCGGANARPALRIGNKTVGNGFTNWTTTTTTGAQVGNTYTVKNIMTYVTGGRTYGLTIDWNYQAPNKYFNWSYNVSVPAGNTNNIRFYYGMDSYVAGADTNDIGYSTNTGGKTVGVYDGTALVLSAFRYISGPLWTAQEVSGYATVKSRISGGTDFSNTVQTTSGDLGYGIDWNFGTGAAVSYTGTIEWRMAPYVIAQVPDLIPGIGQPEANLVVNTISQLPINITNVGNIASSGTHTVVLTIPANIQGPTNSFSNNGWSCGSQSGTTVTCTKITSVESYNIDPYAQETVRIPVKPLLASQGTTVTFVVNISNPGDSNTGNNSASSSLQVAVGAAPAVNPGGVSGSRLWLRASDLTISDGANITTWVNKGNLGTDATQTTAINQPLFAKKTVTNLNDNINFNPLAVFNGTNKWMQIVNGAFGTLSYTGVSVFVVGQNNNISTQNYLLYQTTTSTGTTPRFSVSIPWSDGNIYYDAGDATTSRIQAIWGGTIGKPNLWSMNKNTISTANGFKEDIRRDGKTIGTGTTTISFTGTNNNLFLGSFSGTTNFFSGKLAEILIIAPSVLTNTGQNQIESYLALKYGITLDQTTPVNYTLSNGSIAFNSITMSGFKNNIAGVARDDSSELMQLKSQSITNTGDIIVSTQAPIGFNYSSLVWANDGNATGTWTSTDSPFIDKVRIQREWRFEENGTDTSDLTISYPVSSIPSGLSGSLYLFIDSDSIFSTGAAIYTGTLNSTTNTWDFSLNISDGQYITFGQKSLDTTPPLITYSGSISSGGIIPIGNYTFNFNYTDTGAGINTGSINYSLNKWNSGSSSYGANIGGTYIVSPSIGLSGTILPIQNLLYGKYQLTINVSDLIGNTATYVIVFYVDNVELIIDNGSIDLGNLQLNTITFSPELTITIKTIGAPFNLYMIQNGNFAYLGNIIINWDGNQGFGYDKNPYTGNINLINGNQIIGTGSLNINTSGDKNIYNFKVKVGALNNNYETAAGNYQTTINFLLQLNY